VRNRRRRLLVFLAALALLGTLALPAVHWRLAGWWRGEPFHQGRPASYWATELRAITWGWGRTQDGSLQAFYLRNDDPLSWVKWRLGYTPNFTNLTEGQLPFADRDPAAVPVLVALLRDPEPDVQWWAASLLGWIGSEAKSAVPALIEAIESPDRMVADAAFQSLEKIDPLTATKHVLPVIEVRMPEPDEWKDQWMNQKLTPPQSGPGTAPR